MTLTLQTSYLAYVVQGLGILIVLYAVAPLNKAGLRSLSLVLGLALFWGGSAIGNTSSPPSPLPPAPPSPSGSFADAIKSSFDGTSAEAQILSAIHEQMAVAIEYDGQRPAPAIGNTTQMGQVFAELQRYRAGSNTPWGDRFPAMKQIIAAEASKRGIIGQGSQPMDGSRRASAVSFFRELGAIFESI